MKPVPFLGQTLGLSNPNDIELIIMKEIRLPRVLAGALIGSGLALAGTVFQGVFRNPMADRYVLGVSSGAALGAALAIVMRLGYSALGVYSVSILSFLIATLTVFAVYGLAKVGFSSPSHHTASIRSGCQHFSLISGIAPASLLRVGIAQVSLLDDGGLLLYRMGGRLGGLPTYQYWDLSDVLVLEGPQHYDTW